MQPRETHNLESKQINWGNQEFGLFPGIKVEAGGWPVLRQGPIPSVLTSGLPTASMSNSKANTGQINEACGPRAASLTCLPCSFGGDAWRWGRCECHCRHAQPAAQRTEDNVWSSPKLPVACGLWPIPTQPSPCHRCLVWPHVSPVRIQRGM